MGIEAVFYGKSLTVKDCTEMTALASRSSSVGSIIMSLGHKLCRNNQRLEIIVAQPGKSKK
ncbi:MAG: hypothetical protein M3R11_04255 [Acidobacteriota bacterium]|nr:hypothetical protein [Acidobacteriota bacterium]